jgi:hypothetical protein
MASRKAVIYATNSKLPRRVIIPTYDRELNDFTHVNGGETLLVIPLEHSMDFHELRATIAKHHDMDVNDIPTGRCAVVHRYTGHVISAIIADPELDDHEHKLIPHEVASDDGMWKHDGEQFLVRHVEVPLKGDAVGIVKDIHWHPEGKTPEDNEDVAHLPSIKEIGDKIDGVMNVPSTNTRKI